MIWQNAWALLGLLTLALPVFIHLLSRKRAVRQKFPSLRFLNATRLLPTRSPHLTDIPLLLVRLAVLAIATLALTGPLWLSASRTESFNSSMARVLVVDTSASMNQSAGGKFAADSALALAKSLAAESQASLIVQTNPPAEALTGASAWLTAQRVRGEVVVVSDFQEGTLDGAAIARVAPAFGIKLVRVPTSLSTSDSTFVTSRGRVLATVDSSSTRAEWSADSAAAGVGAVAVTVLAPARDQGMVIAAARAALATWPQRMRDTSRHLAVVFDGATEYAAIAGAAKAPEVGWMSQAIAQVRANSVLSEAAAEVNVRDTSIAAPFAVVASNNRGNAVVYVAQSTVGGSRSLVFFHRGVLANLSAPALLAATNAASELPIRMGENERLSLGDEALAKLAREPGAIDSAATQHSAERTLAGASGLSDARWIWLAALLLLGVEAIMRRRADVNVARETA